MATRAQASDALLLQDRDAPLSVQTFSGCCDTLVAKRKELSIQIAGLGGLVQSRDDAKLQTSLAVISEGILIVTETTAQAIYMVAEKTPGCKQAVPGVIDGYLLARARLAIEVATSDFSNSAIEPPQVMSIAAVVSTHLDILRKQCTAATDKLGRTEPRSAAVFDGITRALTGAAAMLVAAIKSFVSDPQPKHRAACETLSRPIIAVVDGLIEYAKSSDSFAGAPPQMTREVADLAKPIQAGAVSAVSATTLLVGAVKTCLINPAGQTGLSDVTRFSSALESALGELVAAAKRARDSGSLFEDPVN